MYVRIEDEDDYMQERTCDLRIYTDLTMEEEANLCIENGNNHQHWGSCSSLGVKSFFGGVVSVHAMHRV